MRRDFATEETEPLRQRDRTLAACEERRPRPSRRLRLERAQEIDDVLALPSLQPIEMVDDFICLAILAPVGFDSLH